MRDCEFDYYKNALMDSLSCLGVGLDYTDEQYKNAVESLVGYIENKSMAFGDYVASKNLHTQQEQESMRNKEGKSRKDDLILSLYRLLDKHVNPYAMSDDNRHRFKYIMELANRETMK